MNTPLTSTHIHNSHTAARPTREGRAKLPLSYLADVWGRLGGQGRRGIHGHQGQGGSPRQRHPLHALGGSLPSVRHQQGLGEGDGQSTQPLLRGLHRRGRGQRGRGRGCVRAAAWVHTIGKERKGDVCKGIVMCLHTIGEERKGDEAIV
jgi:hypothetical protein